MDLETSIFIGGSGIEELVSLIKHIEKFMTNISLLDKLSM